MLKKVKKIPLVIAFMLALHVQVSNDVGVLLDARVVQIRCGDALDIFIGDRREQHDPRRGLTVEGLCLEILNVLG